MHANNDKAEKIDLIFIPFHDWRKSEREGFRTRDAHLMLEFGKHPRLEKLLVIDRPISCSEMVAFRRGRRVDGGELYWQDRFSSLTRFEKRTYVLDILVPQVFQPLIMRRRWIPYIFRQPFIINAIRSALVHLDINPRAALFISEPFFSPVAEAISPAVFVLDAIDNLLKHSLYQDIPGIQEGYDYCLANADLLFTNSIENVEWFRKSRPDTVYVPNGVDIDFFPSQREYPIPDDLRPLPRPIVGYAGKMQEMFDVELLKSAAKTLPDVTFVCIGQQLNPKWVQPLWEHSNIIYLGDKHYRLLPAYLSAFDICIIPYDLNKQHGGDPIKFYEFLAMGKPVVTTNIGGVGAFESFPNVRIVSGEEQFRRAVSEFADQIRAGCPIPAGKLPNDVLWSSKADLIINAILGKLEHGVRHDIHPECVD